MVRGRRQNFDTQEVFREVMDSFRSDYAIGTNSRFRPRPTGISSSGSGADYHSRLETQFLLGLERARHFDRNNMVVGQGVNRLVANVVQDGFKLDVKTGDEQLDKILAERWKDWSEDPEQCDYEGEKDFDTQAALTFRHIIVDGDILDLPDSETGSLRSVEAHRLRTPRGTTKNVVLGVKKDSRNRRSEYWVTREDVNPTRPVNLVREIKQFPARDEDGHRQVFHHYFPTRFSQTRGITSFAPSVDAIGMHDDIQFATLVKAQVASCFAILEEIELGGEQGTRGGTGPSSTETLEDGSSRVVEGIAPGMTHRGAPGTTLKGFAPNIPSPEFFPHSMMVLTFIAINLDLPVAVLLLDPSNTNFSGWRGAMEQARLRYRQFQRWLSNSKHKRVYKWKVRQWLQEDERIQALSQKSGVNVFDHEFKARGYGYIEPEKDAKSDLIRISNPLASLRRIANEKGDMWDDVSTEIVEDRALLIKKAINKANEINKEFPELKEPVEWRELAPLPVSQGESVLLSQERTESANVN